MALNFDGVDDRVITSATPSGFTDYPISMACVLKFIDFTGDPLLLILGELGGYQWYVDSSGIIHPFNPNTALQASASSAISTGVWTFIGVSSSTRSNHRIFAYNLETFSVINNNVDTTDVGVIGAPDNVAAIGVGYHPIGTYFEFFHGTMAWIAAYQLDLTNVDAFLAMTYLGPFSLGTPTLLYSFNEMTGTTVYEKMGTGNDGTMTNFPGSPWDGISLPGPYWTRTSHRITRSPAVIGSTFTPHRGLMGVGA